MNHTRYELMWKSHNPDCNWHRIESSDCKDDLIESLAQFKAMSGTGDAKIERVSTTKYYESGKLIRTEITRAKEKSE